MPALHKLDLSHNALISECQGCDLDKLMQLKELQLHHNRLTYMPSLMVGLTALVTINFSHNQLASVPPLHVLPLLETLLLGSNCLSDISFVESEAAAAGD